MKSQKNTVSPQTRQEALSIAKATQKPAQTKEQTKLIAQGIEKGISLYKKQQKEKQRDADKLRKKQMKSINHLDNQQEDSSKPPQDIKRSKLPWALLAISWIGFTLYLTMQNN
ncbi:MAG: DUF2956 domain-containing protein [Vibrio casei]|uniref:DUF2956 domain-containing protein n=1 Tax=Vibrio casei TaxID=673372 RepID=UPI003F968163